MGDSFEPKENSVGEAYCLSHIIIINYKNLIEDMINYGLISID